MLTQAKKELGRKTPVIELQFILMRHNFHQRGEMETLARRLGVDAYSEKMVSIDLNEPDCQQLAGEFLPQDLSSSRYYRKSDGALSMRGEVPNGCRRVYESAVIDSDGAVVPCCYDWKREYVMGNVFQERLEDIWRNHRYMSFRKRILKNRNKIPMCSACPEGRINVYSKHTEGISARKKSTPKKENI